MEIVREERRGVLFYVCPEMREAGFPHGFSTRVGGVSPAPWDSLNLGGSCGDDPERATLPTGYGRTTAASAPPSGQTRTAW